MISIRDSLVTFTSHVHRTRPLSVRSVSFTIDANAGVPRHTTARCCTQSYRFSTIYNFFCYKADPSIIHSRTSFTSRLVRRRGKKRKLAERISIEYQNENDCQELFTNLNCSTAFSIFIFSPSRVY